MMLLTSKKLAAICEFDDTIAVFGFSHSSMIIIRELVKIGVEKDY
ncbi:hypothetical protein [Coxiella-like endosymbiont]|nr:hypothetical protein [Coxiella-like endosymbiont]